MVISVLSGINMVIPPYQEEGGRNWEIGIDIHTPTIYINYVTNKDLLYSTGNSSQHSAVAYMVYMYMYNWFTLLYTWNDHNIINQLYSNRKFKNFKVILTVQKRKDTCTPIFTAALLTMAKTWKQCKCPLTDEWVKMSTIHHITLTLLHTHTPPRVLLSHKKE